MALCPAVLWLWVLMTDIVLLELPGHVQMALERSNTTTRAQRLPNVIMPLSFSLGVGLSMDKENNTLQTGFQFNALREKWTLERTKLF